jgi:hypothetical protein
MYPAEFEFVIEQIPEFWQAHPVVLKAQVKPEKPGKQTHDKLPVLSIKQRPLE